MDKASRALIDGVPHGVRNTYRGLEQEHDVARSTLHDRAHGQRSLEEKARGQQYLTPCEEKAMVIFILQMRKFGQRVRVKEIGPLAFSIARQRLTNKKTKPPGPNWPRAFEKRHPELKARRDRPLDWNRFHIYDKVVHWFEVIGKVLQDPDVKSENVYNMDETGVMLSLPGSVKVLAGKDDLRSFTGIRVKRTVVTAIECVSASGKCLRPMIVWPSSTHRGNWTTFPTPGWHYAYSESGYTDSYISLEWLKRVFDPQTRELSDGKPRVLIFDGFGTHLTLEILEFALQNNIKLCCLPSHTSHKLQPCDVGLFGPLKAAYRNQLDRLEKGGVGTIGKQHFTYLYSPAREAAFTKRNILAGWRASGLYAFNPDRVLAEIPKPDTVAKPVISIPKTSAIDLRSHGEVLHTPTSPTSLTTLHVQIRQDACADDEFSKQRLLRHTQKLINAIQTNYAEQSIQRDQIEALREINNEGKVRRSAKSLVLGKARVMSYEDLEDARAKRAAKDAAKGKTKGKRGRKRKNAEPEHEPESSTTGKGKRGRKRKNSEAQADEAATSKRTRGQKRTTPETEPEPVEQTAEMWVVEQQIAPVARML